MVNRFRQALFAMLRDSLPPRREDARSDHTVLH